MLKKRKSEPLEKKNRRVVWDEENLQYNEEHKEEYTKIDEPKTPYNYLSLSSDNDEDEEDMDRVDREGSVGDAMEQDAPEEGKCKKRTAASRELDHANFMSEVTEVLSEVKVDGEKQKPAALTAFDDPSPERERTEEEEEHFLEMRKQNYSNMGNLLKKKWSDDDEVEGEDAIE